MACRILIPWPGIKPMPPAVETRSLNHWTVSEVPVAASSWHSESPMMLLLLRSPPWWLCLEQYLPSTLPCFNPLQSCFCFVCLYIQGSSIHSASQGSLNTGMVCLIYLCIFSSEDTGWHIVDAQKTLSEKEKVPQQLGHLVNCRRFQKILEGSRNLMQGKRSHRGEATDWCRAGSK